MDRRAPEGLSDAYTAERARRIQAAVRELSRPPWWRATRTLASALGYLAVCAVVDGVAVMLLWNWFVARLGQPLVSVGSGIGLVLLARFMTRLPRPSDLREPRLPLSQRVGLVVVVVLLGGLVARWQ